MILIAGLGNPGAKYAHTRHNVGFLAVDAIATYYNLQWSTQKTLQGDIARGDSFILLKPATFMNDSGLSLQKTLTYFRIEQKQDSIWVLHDELDLAQGIFRIHQNKSAAGHNGIQSIIDHLQSQEFTRWRIGIGRPTNTIIPTAEYVLQKFTNEENTTIQQLLPTIVESVEYATKHNLSKAINKYNSSPTG